MCPFPPHGWSAPDGLPLLLRKQPIRAAGDTPHLMPVEQGLPWHSVATWLAGQAIPFVVAVSHAHMEAYLWTLWIVFRTSDGFISYPHPP